MSSNATAIDDILYQFSTNTLSAQWHYSDPESKIQKAWYSVGTTPGGQEVSEIRDTSITSNQMSSVEVGQIRPDTSGTSLIMIKHIG